MPYLTPDAPGSFSGRVLLIPDTYIASVNGALEELANEWNWEAFGTETVDDAVERMRTMIEEFQMSSVSQDTAQRIGMIPIGAYYSGSSTLQLQVSTEYLHNTLYTFTTPANGNLLIYKIACPAGYHMTLQMRVTRRANAPTLEVTWAGSSCGTVDLYNSTTLRNTFASWTLCDTPNDGVHDLIISVAGRHPSSTGWNVELCELAYRIDEP